MTVNTKIFVTFIAQKRACISVKCFHLIFTSLVAVILLSDIMIISLTIMIITLMIYRDIKSLSLIPNVYYKAIILMQLHN